MASLSIPGVQPAITPQKMRLLPPERPSAAAVAAILFIVWGESRGGRTQVLRLKFGLGIH